MPKYSFFLIFKVKSCLSIETYCWDFPCGIEGMHGPTKTPILGTGKQRNRAPRGFKDADFQIYFCSVGRRDERIFTILGVSHHSIMGKLPTEFSRNSLLRF